MVTPTGVVMVTPTGVVMTVPVGIHALHRPRRDTD